MSIKYFKTIENSGEGFYKEKGSKFLSFAYPVKHEEEVKEHLKGLKTTYYDARHHCYAFMIGAKGDIFRAGDDGEPSNSAGIPILNQLRSFDVTNVLIVVVRYFGGTKLGVSGLINAYSAAAKDALSNTAIVEDYEKQPLVFSFDYPDMNTVMHTLEQEGIQVCHQNFTEKCVFHLEVALGVFSEVKQKLQKILTVQILQV